MVLEPPDERQWEDGPRYTSSAEDKANGEFKLVVTQEDLAVGVHFVS